MRPNETPVITKQDTRIAMTQKITMATGKLSNSIPYFVFGCLYLKQELGDPYFCVLVK